MATLKINGDTSGYVELVSPAVAGSTSIALDKIVVADSSGNVGIGTADPNGKLTVALENSNTPAFRLSSPTSSTDFAISSYNDANGTYVSMGVNHLFDVSGNDAVMDTNDKSAAIALDGRNNGRIQFLTNSSGIATPRMTILQDGKVGIGTASPDTTLDIRGSGQFRNTNGLLFFTDNGTAGATNVNGAFIGMAHNAGHHVTGDDGGFGSAANSLVIGNYHTGGGDIILATTNSGPYASGRVIIKENGNVGIGTDSPSTKLHVEGNIRAGGIYQEGAESSSSAFVMSQGVNTTRASVALWAKDNGSYPGQVHIVSHSANASANSGKIMFWDYNGSAWNANGAWDKDGNLGVGTTSPSDKLTVSGGHINLTSSAYGIKLPGAITSDGQINHVNAGSVVTLQTYPLSNQTLRLKGLTDKIYYHSDRGNPDYGEVFGIDTYGRVTMPHQPGFAAVRNSAYNYTGGTGYNTISSWYSGTTKQSFSTGDFNYSTGVFTAPVSGKYTFKFQILLSGVNTGDDGIHVAFYTNGGITQYGNIRAPGSSASSVVGYGLYLPVIGSTDVYLSANDSVDLRMTSSGNISVYGGTDWSRFSGYLIG